MSVHDLYNTIPDFWENFMSDSVFEQVLRVGQNNLEVIVLKT